MRFKIFDVKIKEYGIGEHCFGPILQVNGQDYEDLDQGEVIEFINDRMENDINSHSLIRQFFILCLEHLQFEYDGEQSYRSTCDQCGNWNSYERWYDDEEDNDNGEGAQDGDQTQHIQEP